MRLLKLSSFTILAFAGLLGPVYDYLYFQAEKIDRLGTQMAVIGQKWQDKMEEAKLGISFSCFNNDAKCELGAIHAITEI